MHLIRSYFPQLHDIAAVMVAQDIMVPSAPQLAPDDNLDHALKLFERSQREELPVVVDGEIRGVLTHSESIAAYNKSLHHMNLMHELGDSIPGADTDDSVDLGDGYHLKEVSMPRSFVGEKVKDLHLGKKYQVQILMIKTPDQLHVTAVSGETVLKSGQILLLMGPEKEVEKITRL
jgi:CBS domain-containing protein